MIKTYLEETTQPPPVKFRIDDNCELVMVMQFCCMLRLLMRCMVACHVSELAQDVSNTVVYVTNGRALLQCMGNMINVMITLTRIPKKAAI